MKNIVYKIKDGSYKFNIMLGAGASVSSNMPLASDVIGKILHDYKKNPEVLKLGSPTYVDAVSALDAIDRKRLFEEYICKSHISITYLYIAELYRAGYLKYIFTTNFDDLILRALAIKGIFPPIYDLTTIENFSSGKPSEGAVIFFHGRHNGDWQLNTQSEMLKVKEKAKKIFTQIEDNRWLVVGYSGGDLIFDSLNSYCSRYDAKLFWIGHKDFEPSDKIKASGIFDDLSRQAYYIKGYDSDLFFKSLYKELIGSNVPQILSKPFSTMAAIYDGVIAIDEKQYPFESLFLGMAKSQISSMTTRFENRSPDSFSSHDNEFLIKEIFSIIEKKEFNTDRAKELENLVLFNHNIFLYPVIGEFYREYGSYLFNLGLATDGSILFSDALVLFEKSEFYFGFVVGFKKRLYSNWFLCLFELSKRKRENDYYHQALEIAEKAIEEDPNYPILYFNRGCAYFQLASPTKIQYLKKAITDFDKAISLDDGYVDAWENCGICYRQLSTVENRESNIALAHQKFIGAFKRGSVSINLIQSCLLKDFIEEALGYLEAIVEKDEGFIKKYFSYRLDPPFNKLEHSPRFLELKKQYI